MFGVLKAFLEPGTVIAGERLSLTLNIIVGNNGIDKGDKIIISVFGRNAFAPFFQSINDLSKSKDGCYVSASCQQANLKLYTKNDGMYRIIEIEPEENLSSGDEIKIVFGDKKVSSRYMKIRPFAHIHKFNIYVHRKKDDFSTPIPDPPILKVKNAPVSKLIAYIDSTAVIGEKVDILVKAVDKYGNLAEDYAGKIKFTSTDPKSMLRLSYCFSQEDYGLRKWHSQLIFYTPGIHTITVEDEENGLICETNPIEIKPKKPPYRIYWGEIHGHTILSDGLETPDYYFWWAKEVEKLDFSALTDHAYGNDLEELDHPALKDDDKSKSYRKLLPQAKFPFWPSLIGRWRITKYVTESWNKVGEFITFLAYEWTSGHKGELRYKPYGHKNVYYLGSNGPCYNYTDCKEPEELWETLSNLSQPFITIPHHPAYPLGNGVCGVDWNFHNDNLQPLVEIYSKHGASEFFNNPRPLLSQSKGQFVQDALYRGYKLGFIAGSDTHISRPGSDCPEASKELQYRQSGLTAVFAEDLTRNSIFNALKNRRCYATTHPRIILYFKVNGCMMGEELNMGQDDEGLPREIYIKVVGTEKIDKVDIIRNGKDIYSHRGKAKVEEFKYLDNDSLIKIALQSNNRSFVYYYARITQIDGERAWSSPVFITGFLDNRGVEI